MIMDTGCKYNITSSTLRQNQFKNFGLSATEKRFAAYEKTNDCIVKAFLVPVLERITMLLTLKCT